MRDMRATGIAELCVRRAGRLMLHLRLWALLLLGTRLQAHLLQLPLTHQLSVVLLVVGCVASSIHVGILLHWSLLLLLLVVGRVSRQLLWLLLLLPDLLRLKRLVFIAALEAHGHGDGVAWDIPDGSGSLDVGRASGLQMLTLGGETGGDEGSRLGMRSASEAVPDTFHTVSPQVRAILDRAGVMRRRRVLM